MGVAVSGFALENGEFVYTPQGRFQITGDNLNANSAFQDFTGWTLVTAAEGKTLADQFNINGNGYAPGISSVQSLDATAGEGMYYKFVPTSAADVYVVSYKMKGAFATSIRIKTNALSTNLVRVKGNSGEDFGADSLNYVCFNTAEELGEEWQTFNYAIVGDGTARTYYISFTGIDSSIEIADLQIAPAMQFADLRQRDAMLDKLNAYKNCYNWSEDVLSEYSMNDAIEGLKAIGDESGVDELNEVLETAEAVLDEFLNKNMDDYLAGNNDNYLKTWRTKTQKASTYGVWTGTDRLFWENAGTPFDIGHYQQSATWANGNPTKGMGVTTQKDLAAGSYVFAIDAAGMFRENAKGSWDSDDGIKPAYGVAYVAKVVDGAVTDTIISQVQDVSNIFIVDDSKGERRYLGMTPFSVTAKLAEDGKYEFGMIVYCKEAYQSLARGSAAALYNASIWGKNANKYNQKQLGYEADVLEQITTGRNQLTTAAENIANENYLWGKAELQACVDTVETKIAAYEKLTQDDIIATYEEDYAKSTSEETGYMVYEVYQTAVKDIIAANKRFLALNDTLNSIQVAIDDAYAAKENRLYSAATGTEALDAAIQAAKDVQAKMQASQYSEENAAAIVEAVKTLNAAIDAFKASVPADAVATIADIDFSTLAVEREIDNVTKWVIAGAVNEMILPNYTADGTGTTYGQGLFLNAEHRYADTLRVGNGTAEVIIAADQQVGGSDILKIDFDYYFGNLIGKNAGFELQNKDSVAIADLFFSAYSGNDSGNTFGVNYTALPKVGDRNNSNAAIAAESNKTHFEVVLDYGTKTMYCNIVARTGSQITTPVKFDGSQVARFLVKSDYNNADRRCWFDNLKIQRINAAAVEAKGDANGDGTVDVADVDFVIEAIGGEYTKAADVNGDGAVDVADVDFIIEQIQ